MSGTHGIFRIEHGFAYWAHSELMSGQEANAFADRQYPDCHVLPYWKAKQLQDPDTMSEPALRRKLGMPDARNGSVAITGKGQREMRSILEGKGFRVVSEVSSATRALYIGDEPSQRKIDKARKLGVVVKRLAR